jgi:hypothetical protein
MNGASESIDCVFATGIGAKKFGVQRLFEYVVKPKNGNLTPKCSFNRRFFKKYSMAV